MNSRWVRVVNDGDMENEDSVCIEDGSRKIAVFYVDGEYYAMDDLCTHERASLSEGFIYGKTVECPLHQSVFSLETGEVLTPPAETSVNTFAVKVDGGVVYVNLGE